jgi:TetR/AcrR family transcriptional regulator, regulator of cefoperazone and chloramphenicol sensitivity
MIAAPVREDEATRTKLLHSAAAVFAEVGYNAATVRQICAHAQVNVASVNYHFGDKLGLYTEVLRHSAGPDAQLRIRAAMSAAATPEDALRIFVRGIFEKVYGDKPEADVKIMTQEMVNPTPAFDAVIEQVIRPQYKQLCSVIGRILGRPPTAAITRLCVYSFMGQVMHYFHGREVIARLSPGMKVAAERDRIADHIVNFTLAGLQSETLPTARKRS